ncbi:hypothetical protein TNCV_1789271 [Trichonephila clavipes]|nr:hypothetical protein TNCV_1789271 [Trichonephila clavipes]
MSPTGKERRRRNIRTRQNPFGPQERQTRISKAKIQRVKTGGPRTLQRRNRQRKPQRRNHQRTELRGKRQKELSEHIFKNLSDLASLKNNFTEQLTDDEYEDSAPFSLESTNDANKQPLTPPIYHLPSPQDVFVPLLQTQRNQSQREMRKTVKINGYDFDALIDTGSTITLIRESVYQILGRPTLNATKTKLTSFGKSEIKTFGSFKSTIDIEDNKFMTDIYVIDNLQTTIDVIIGTDVLKQTEFKITANEDKCKNLEMHVSNTSTLSLEKTALLDKLHELEESNLEKVDKLVKLEEKYEILQETLKITERRLVEKEIECASLTEKYSS